MLWSVDEQLLSEPAIAGDTVLAYVDTKDRREAVVAWDLKTGEELWRRRTMTGSTSRLSEAHVALISGDNGWQTSVLLPRSDDAARDDLVAVAIPDAHTGADLAADLASEGVYAHRPFVCGEANDRFCVQSITEHQYDNRFHIREYSAAEPELRAARISGPVHDSEYWELSDHAAFDEDTGDLVYDEHGERGWRRPYEEVFGPDAHPSGGWVWSDDVDDDPDAPLLAWGAVNFGGPHVDGEPRTLTEPLTGDRVVRLDRETGATIWSMDAGECLFLEAGLRVYGDVVPLCRYLSGAVESDWDGHEVTNVRFTSVELEVVGVDVATGDVRWSLNVGSGGTERRGTDAAVEFPHDGDELVTLNADGNLVQIDAGSGKVSTVSTDQVVPCGISLQLTHLDSRRGENLLYFLPRQYALCDEKGEFRTDTTLSSATLEAAGFDSMRISVINTTDGLVAYSAR